MASSMMGQVGKTSRFVVIMPTGLVAVAMTTFVDVKSMFPVPQTSHACLHTHVHASRYGGERDGPTSERRSVHYMSYGEKTSQLLYSRDIEGYVNQAFHYSYTTQTGVGHVKHDCETQEEHGHRAKYDDDQTGVTRSNAT